MVNGSDVGTAIDNGIDNAIENIDSVGDTIDNLFNPTGIDYSIEISPQATGNHKISSRLLKGRGQVDLSLFNRKGPMNPKGGRQWLGSLGYYIVQEASRGNPHGGSAWKLFDRADNLIATLDKLGMILRFKNN